MAAESRREMWRAFSRSLPVGLAVLPVAMLFGLVAAQSGWNAFEVFLLSFLGFSGSGQFAYLKLSDQAVPAGLVLMIILLINLRYIPMSFTAARGLRGGPARRSILAHFVSDESFALEQPRADPPVARMAVRLTIAVFWIVPTVLGALLAATLPANIGETLGRLTFPASVLLILLGLLRVRWFVGEFRRAGLLAALAAAVIALAAYLVLGARYFWLPSIIVGSLVMYAIAYRGRG